MPPRKIKRTRGDAHKGMKYNVWKQTDMLAALKEYKEKLDDAGGDEEKVRSIIWKNLPQSIGSNL